MEFEATWEDSNYPSSSDVALSESDNDGGMRFRFMSADELGQRAQKEWLIQGILPQRSAAVLVGRYNTYKSFVALDMAWSIASGMDWHGRTVESGHVAYVMAEGASGLSDRLQAWQQVRGTVPAACYYLDQAVQLADVNDADQMLRALDHLDTLPQFVVIDTLARCMVGRDENSVRDMGQFVAGIDRIREYCGATVLVVHHCGKDGTPRGSTALASAMDTEILVERRKGGVVLTCNKQKDAAEFHPVVLEPRSHSHRGHSSIVLHTIDAADGAHHYDDHSLLNGLTERSWHVLDVLATYGTNGARYSEWEASCAAEGVGNRSFDKAREVLLDSELVTHSDRLYRCSDEVLDKLRRDGLI